MSCRASMARRACAAGLSAALLSMPLSACSRADAASGASSATASSSAVSVSVDPDIDHLIQVADHVSDSDLDPSYEDGESTKIQLSDAGCSVSGTGASADGSKVTITAAGTYVVSGTLSNGQIVVNAGDEKVQIVLNDAHVTSADSAALFVRGAKKVWVTLADGTSSSLSTTGAYAQDAELSIDAAVWCKSDLTFNGSGALSVSSASGHGIACKDELVLVSGSVSVDAARSAIQAKDSAYVIGGSWTLVAGTDGIHCGDDDDAEKGSVVVAGGDLSIKATSDGIDAGNVLEVDGGSISVSAGDDGLHADRALQVDGGTIDVAECYEGLEGSTVTINAGEVSIVSTDDGVNAAGDPDDTSSEGDSASSDDSDSGTAPASDGADAAGQPPSMDDGGAAGQPGGEQVAGASKQPAQDGFGNGGMDYDSTAQVTINGGKLTIQASGDGIDSNGDLTVTGGEVYVFGPTSGGDGSLDYGGTGTITGGVVVCAGSSGMAQNFGSTSTQVSIMVSAEGQEGDCIKLSGSDGKVLAQATAATAYSCVIVSAPSIQTNETYTLTCGDASSEITPDSTSYSNVGRAGGGGDGDRRDAGGNGGPGGAGPQGAGGKDGSGGGDPGAPGSAA